MGWIKVELPEDAHDELRKRVEQSDDPTHVVAGEMLLAQLEKQNPEETTND